MNERNQQQRQRLLDFAKRNAQKPKRKPRGSINPAIRLPSWERLLEIDAQAEADAQRFRAVAVAKEVDPTWLGIGAESRPQDAPGRARTGQRDSDIETRPEASERILGDADDRAGIMEARKSGIGS